MALNHQNRILKQIQSFSDSKIIDEEDFKFRRELIAQYHLSVTFNINFELVNKKLICGDLKYKIVEGNEAVKMYKYTGIVIFEGSPDDYISDTIVITPDIILDTISKSYEKSSKRSLPTKKRKICCC